MNQVVLNLTPSGMVPSKALTPHVPITVTEITEQVHEAVETVGVTILHLHARDKDGKPTSDPDIYAKLIESIRSRHPDLVICVSLSGRHAVEIEKRSAPLFLASSLKPDMGSLTTSSLNFVTQASLNAPDTVQRLASMMRELNIVPEIEVFDLGMINYAKYLIRKQLIKPPFYFNIILGNIASAQMNPMTFGLMVNELPENSIWAVGGIGEYQLLANTFAIACGGGVRIGLEDNIFYDTGKTRLASNLDLLKRIKQLADIFERPIMAPNEFRKIMGLPCQLQN